MVTKATKVTQVTVVTKVTKVKASVANFKCCKVQVLQSASVAKCKVDS